MKLKYWVGYSDLWHSLEDDFPRKYRAKLLSCGLRFARSVDDQMFTTIGWKELADMVRAAQGSDMAVFARIENGGRIVTAAVSI